RSFGAVAVWRYVPIGNNAAVMTTRKHTSDDADGGQKTPIEARLEARIAQQSQAAAATGGEQESAVAEARDRYLRLAADFENYKKRARQEQLDTIQHASTQLIAHL